MASLQSAPAGGKVAGNGEERTPAAAAAPGASEELLPMLHQVRHRIHSTQQALHPSLTANRNTTTPQSNSNEVGGHRAASDEEAPYMLRLRPHLVLKIVQDGARGERELGFYRRLFPEVDGGGGDGDGDGGGGRQSPAGGGDDDGLAFLRPFVPAFYGVRTVSGVGLGFDLCRHGDRLERGSMSWHHACTNTLTPSIQNLYSADPVAPPPA